MSWTDERAETLKKMWAEGQSASQIAKELGGVTRNAVIGKVHRLGLSNRVGAGNGRDDGDEAEAPAAAAPAAAPPPPPRARPHPRRTARAPPPLPQRRPPRSCPCRSARPSSPPVNPCRRSLPPTKSRPRLWPRSAKSKSAPSVCR